MNTTLLRALGLALTFLLSPTARSFFGVGAPAEPLVALMPTSLDFGNQAQGIATEPRAIGLTNSGNGDLAITNIAVSGLNAEDFSQANNCPASPATLARGASCAINVMFKPTATGARTATLSITDNASGSPQTATLSGNGTTPAPVVKLSPAALNFANQAVSATSEPKIVTLTNAGSLVLDITSNITITGPNSAEFAFVAANTTCPLSTGQLAAGANCTMAVTFTPTSVGAKAAQITIVDNAEGSPHAVPLNGNGTAPK